MSILVRRCESVARAIEAERLDLDRFFDGFEFLSTVRSQKARADLPIVMLTSRGGEKHREKAQALGATGYLVKPFREDVLIETIARVVQTAPAAKRAVS